MTPESPEGEPLPPGGRLTPMKEMMPTPRFAPRRAMAIALASAAALAALSTLMCGRGERDLALHKAFFAGMGEGNVVAEIGDLRLTEEHFLTLYNNLPEATRRAMPPEKFLDNYISQKLLYFDAVESGMHMNPELRARLELTWNDIFSVHYYSIKQKMNITEEAMRQHYEDNRETLVRPERVRVRQIVVTPQQEGSIVNSAKDDAIGEDAALKKIRRMEERLKAGETLESLARQYAEDHSALQGGDIGFIRRGQADPEFEKAAFAMRALGERSGIVKSRFGYHILELIDREEGGYLTYAEAKPRIIAALEPPQNPAEREKHMEEALAALKQRYGVRVHKDRIPTP